MENLTKDKKGYSLVELMVVITIMAILAAASTPIFTGYIKKARSAEYLAECRAVYMAVESYMIEHGDTFDGSEGELEELAANVCEITMLDVGIAEQHRRKKSFDYEIRVEKKNRKWSCEEITCRIDDEMWVYEVESGTFCEKE